MPAGDLQGPVVSLFIADQEQTEKHLQVLRQQIVKAKLENNHTCASEIVAAVKECLEYWCGEAELNESDATARVVEILNKRDGIEQKPLDTSESIG